MNGLGSLSLYKQWGVTCGNGCGDYADFDHAIKPRVEAELRQEGWSKTVRLGWVCPECKEKIK